MGESDIQTETNIDKPTETPIENADPQQNEEEKKNNSEESDKSHSHGSHDSKTNLPSEKNNLENCDVHNSVEFCELIKILMNSDANEEHFALPSEVHLRALPPRQYLEETVVPILMQALEFLVVERPAEPINALCVYLLKFKSKFEKCINSEKFKTNNKDKD